MSNCGCNPPTLITGSCETEEINSSCCGNVSQATPTPYYVQAGVCQESHCQTLVTQQFYATLKVANSWNIPACEGSAVLSIPGLAAIAIGSYLWADPWGYFEVIAFDSTNAQVTVQNNCTDGNQPVGTQVPGNTYFVVAPPPSVSGGGGPTTLYPYVAIDFTAPANGACLDITVTTVAGLAVGKNIQIGSGIYRLSSIGSSTIVNICNDGFGITPGTSVIAQNGAGQYQYPLILIDTNPCTNTPVTSGALIVCKDSLMQPLEGTTDGMIPVLDADTGEVTFEILDVPTRTCATLTACLTLVPGQATYTITVSDSSQFTVGDLLQIGTRTDRLTVTDIPDATHVTGTLDPIPGTIVDIAPGVSVCIADCCEILDIKFTDMFANLDVQYGYNQSADKTGTLATGTPSITSNEATATITNPTDKNMLVIYTAIGRIEGYATGANTATCSVQFELQTYDNAPYATVNKGRVYFFTKTDGNNAYDLIRTWVGLQTIAAGASTNLKAKINATWSAGGAATYVIEHMIVDLSYFAVAV